MDFGDFLRDYVDKTGIVAFAAETFGGEIGAIGF